MFGAWRDRKVGAAYMNINRLRFSVIYYDYFSFELLSISILFGNLVIQIALGYVAFQIKINLRKNNG